MDPQVALPRIILRTPTSHPTLFRKRLGEFDRAARHGDLVEVRLEDNTCFGYGIFNPRAEATVRMVRLGPDRPDLAWWQSRLAAAVAFRRDTLKLDEHTNAYRIIHGKRTMPAFGQVLSESEIWDLMNFIRSLRIQ